MVRFGRVQWFGALAAILAACSSLPLGTAERLRTVDYLNDDIASMTFAFDLPRTLEPSAEGSLLDFRVSAISGGERHVTAKLVRADAGDVVGSLPPPASDRTYYLFGFTAADGKALREAQAWARGLGRGEVVLAVDFDPRFCNTAAVDLAATRVSVHVTLPGASRLAPLVDNESVKAVLAAAGETALPNCAGGSG